MVGDPNVGKTTIFWKYIEGEFLAEKSATVTTIDFKIREIKINREPIKLYIWDTAGQQRYRSIVSTYFKGCDGVMLVFDLTKPESFTNVTTKWYQLAKAKSPDAQLILIGNKSDLEVVFDDKQAELWAKDHRAIYVRTSVKMDRNVNEAYTQLSEAIYNAPKVVKAKSFALHKNLLQQDKKKGKSCC